MKLNDRVTLVTGGASGIGRAICLAVAREGGVPVVADINLDGAGKVVAEATRGSVVEMDVRDPVSIAAGVEAALREHGRIDILVNNAGGDSGQGSVGSPFTQLTVADWDELYQKNLRALHLVTAAVVPGMIERRSGRIVNIASVAGMQASEMLPAYGAMKAGAIHFTRTLARELARHNINVNAICPGLVWTPTWEKLAADMIARRPQLQGLSTREVFLRSVERSVPLGREQTPEDVAGCAVFLVSDDAASITGQAIAVDGGITA
jgi:NAD(P)-dependent dehydrogenase (short-subunit alcohol dehydrogenase family)